jgi:hypothetical protein
VLLDRVDDDKSERDVALNQSLRRFNAIEWTKARMEAAFPETISWVDVLAITVRDSLVLMGGYHVRYRPRRLQHRWYNPP